MLKDALVFVAWLTAGVVAAWITLGWKVGAGVALMLLAAGVADYLWARMTGATVSEWFWRKRKRWPAILFFVFWMAVGLAWHLLGW